MSPRLVLSPLPAGVYILIGAGALIMVVGFLGCCGAVQESQCMLGLVSVPLLPTATLTPGLQDLVEQMGWDEVKREPQGREPSSALQCPWAPGPAPSPSQAAILPPSPVAMCCPLPFWSFSLVTSLRQLNARTLFFPFSRTTFAFFP